MSSQNVFQFTLFFFPLFTCFSSRMLVSVSWLKVGLRFVCFDPGLVFCGGNNAMCQVVC